MNNFGLTKAVGVILISISAVVSLSACNLHSLRPENIIKNLPILPVPPLLVPHGVVVVPRQSHRQQHNYQYYPDSQVYFDVDANNYFYFSHDAWVSSGTLPDSIHLQQDNWVHIEMNSPKPYSRHQRHMRKYPHGWVKPRHKRKHKKRRDH